MAGRRPYIELAAPPLGAASARSSFDSASDTDADLEHVHSMDSADSASIRASLELSTSIAQLPKRICCFPMGLFYMLMSSLCQSLITLLVRLAGKHVSAFSMVFYRSIVMTVLTVYLILRRKSNEERIRSALWGPGSVRLWLVARGVAGFTAISALYFTVVKLGISVAVTLSFMSPLLTTYLSAIFLSEQCGRRDVVASCIALAGVLLIARPVSLFGRVEGQDPPGTFALLIGVTSAISLAVVYILVRKVRSVSMSPLVPVLYASVSSLVLAPIMMACTADEHAFPQGTGWILVSSVGILGLLAQLTLTLGLMNEKAGLASSMNYLQVVYGFLFDLFIFGESKPWQSYIGSLLIVGSAVYINMRRVRR